MRRRNLMLLAGALGTAAGADAQLSPWYITDGNSGPGNTHIMRFGVQQAQYPWASDGQIPIYVAGTVRQANYQGVGFQGDEYTLNGAPTNVQNYWTAISGQSYDAGFDGTNVYMVDYFTGMVSKWDANYANGVNVFQANPQDVGITVDGSGNIWTSNFGSGLISGYSPNGQPFAQFAGPASYLSALAWDSQDNTLWIADAFGQVGVQYTMQGNPTGGQTLLPAYVLGGEMPRVPAPGAASLAGLAGVVAMRRRR